MVQFKGVYPGLTPTLPAGLVETPEFILSFAMRTSFKCKREKRPPFLSGVGLVFLTT